MTIQTDKTQQALTILQRAVCLTLECHYLGNNRAVDLKQLSDVLKGETDVDATKSKEQLDEEQFHATKKLINPKAVRPVLNVQNRAKAFLRSNTIAGHRIFGERSYFIPIDLVEIVDKRLEDFASELTAEAYKLAEKYNEEIEAQRSKLGSLFNADDYMTPADVRKAFSMSWDYVSFGAPEKLETVSKALFDRTRAKFETKMASAYDEVRLVLRQSLLEIVQDVAKKLEPGADGKRKSFHSTVLDDVAEYLSTFKARNIADDAELDSIVAMLRKATKGVDVKQLKDIDAVRESVLKTVKTATKKLDKLVVETRGRSINLDEV